jgi:hypothetical protein
MDLSIGDMWTLVFGFLYSRAIRCESAATFRFYLSEDIILLRYLVCSQKGVVAKCMQALICVWSKFSLDPLNIPCSV